MEGVCAGGSVGPRITLVYSLTDVALTFSLEVMLKNHNKYITWKGGISYVYVLFRGIYGGRLAADF